MSNAFQTCLKGFKLKIIVVEQKMTQSVESNEKLVDLFSLLGWKVQKPYLSSRMLIRSIKVELHPVEYQSRGSQGPMVTYHTLNAKG